MGSITPTAVRKQIAAGTPDAIYLILGEDEVEKSGLAGEFAELVIPYKLYSSKSPTNNNYLLFSCHFSHKTQKLKIKTNILI